MHQIILSESEAIIIATKVSIDQMASAIMDGLKEYADLATDDLKAAVKKTGNEVRKQIQSTAPKASGKYSKSWSVKTTKESSNGMEVTVYSRNRYQLAHLLEFGHAKRGGGRVAARPHIAAAEQAGIESFEQAIERSLRNG
nr:HK97 gp10 family phage protein [Absicoccus porci]